MSDQQGLIAASSDRTASAYQRDSGRAKVCSVCGSDRITKFLSAPDRFHLRREVYRLLRCSSCSCVRLDCPPKPQEMYLHYDTEYHAAIASGGEKSADSRWLGHRRKIARYKSGGTILDIGCSSGGFLGTMKSGSWKLYGIEMEASTADRARLATGAEVFVGNAVDAPFAAQSFDVITCFDVLEHVYDPPEFLTRVQKWLKPGGIFFVMLPNIDSWEARMFGSFWYGLELPRHLTHFSPKSLRHLMTRLGFRELALRTVTSYAERSLGYICSAAAERLGFSPEPQSRPRQPSVLWRILRKGIRVSAIQPFGWLASWAGRGASMEAIFEKPRSAANTSGANN